MLPLESTLCTERDEDVFLLSDAFLVEKLAARATHLELADGEGPHDVG